MTDHSPMPSLPSTPPTSSANEETMEMLRTVRTHLTVAMLAAQHLHRTHPHAESVAHLFTHLHTAHRQLIEDVRKIEAILEELQQTRP